MRKTYTMQVDVTVVDETGDCNGQEIRRAVRDVLNCDLNNALAPSHKAITITVVKTIRQHKPLDALT